MEAEKKTGGGGGGAGAVVNQYSSENRRQFYIELKPGETTIVSWAKLLRESGSHVGQSPPPSPEPPKEYNQGQETISECADVKEEQKEPNNGSSLRFHGQPKKRRADLLEDQEENVVQATKDAKLRHVTVKPAMAESCYNDELPPLNASVASSMEKPSVTGTKLGSPRHEMTSNPDGVCAVLESRTSPSHIKLAEYSVNSERMELPDLNLPYPLQAANPSPIHIKNESGDVLSGTMLDKMILELEKMVAESIPLYGGDKDADQALATKSRLPRELKQKLEQVARLAHSSQGRISEELITRLLSILGHWLKPRTLKRYLKEMVPYDLSAGRAEDERFTQIKKEVFEMIKLRTPSLGAKSGPSNGMLELAASHKVQHSMDHEMEDKICDFYDVYVEGMSEVKNPEIRKFYIQLADLWPVGTMDNHGIRNAICRAKERRRMLLQEKGHEDGKRNKLTTTRMDENLHGEVACAYPKAMPVRQENDSSAPVSTLSDTVVPSTPELDQNLIAPAKRSSPPSVGSCKDLLKQVKFDVLEDLSMEVSVKRLEMGNKVRSPSRE